MPAGRPTEYEKEYCEMLIEHMANGLSYESFAGKLRVCRDTLYNWEKLFPEFSYSKKVGKEASLLKWEELGLAGVEGKIEKFNAPTYIFTMKNRFDWRDKTETENKNTNDSSRLIVQFNKDDE
jgi:hypothetical protein